MKRLTASLFRFSTQTPKPQTNPLSTAQQQFQQTPVYLKPYDKSKYELPMPKIKKNSGTPFTLILGYALLQIEPFPRARIMRLSYQILQQLRIGIPENYPIRIFLEQRTKYVMEITDKITDPEELQDFFGTDSIELFILGLSRNLHWIDQCRKHKFWEHKEDEESLPEMEELKKITSPQSLKYPIYKKGQRPTSKFLD